MSINRMKSFLQTLIKSGANGPFSFQSIVVEYQHFFVELYQYLLDNSFVSYADDIHLHLRDDISTWVHFYI